MLKKAGFFLLIIWSAFLFIPVHLSAIPVRNVTDCLFDTYLYDAGPQIGITAEDTFLLTLRPGFTLLIRANWMNRGSWNRFTGTAGLVFGVSKYIYAEVSYGLGYDSGNFFMHTVNTDWYLETAGFLGIIGFKGQFSSGQQTLLPSIALKYFFTDFFSLWGKYIFIYDSATKIDHSFWTEAEFIPLPWFRFKAGGTVASYHPDSADPQRNAEISGLAGTAFLINDHITVKYIFQYTWRKEYSKITNELVADIRFR